MKYEFYLGSYANADQSSIYRYELDTEKDTLQEKEAVKGIDRPSYLLPHPKRDILYAVEELNPEGRVAAILSNDRLEYLSSLSAKGADPCQLSLDESGRYLFVSNYSSGGLEVLRLDEEGVPIACTDYKQHTGKGENAERQEGPHVHFSGMVDGILYVCDLGLDRVLSYELDQKSGTLTMVGKDIELPKGFGPRHFAVHEMRPDLLYVVGELSNEVAVFRKREGGYRLEQLVSTLPDHYEEDSAAAAIKFNKDGTILFVSNRGHDSITSFLVRKDGTLEKGEICSCGGKGPRDFEIFGNRIVVANQYSDCLTIMEYSAETGKMKLLSGSTAVSTPVMICAI